MGQAFGLLLGFIFVLLEQTPREKALPPTLSGSLAVTGVECGVFTLVPKQPYVAPFY